MINPRAFTTLAAVSAIDPDTRKQWIELLPAHDEERNGKFLTTVTSDDLEVYAQSIRDIGGGLLSFDRDHDGAVGGSTKAAGWLTGEARVGDDSERGAILEVEVEWTPTAAQEIDDGEFRFVSAEYRFASKDSKTGLMSGAKPWESGDVVGTLTNRPFFGQLAALAADGQVVWAPEQGVNYVMGLVSAALNPSDGDDEYRYWLSDIDIAAGLALVSENDATWVVPFTREGDSVTLAAQADWTQAKQEWVSAATAANAALEELRQLHVKNGGVPASIEGAQMSDELKALATELGLPEDATAEDIKTHNDEKAERITALETELAELRATASAVQDGRAIMVDPTEFEALKGQAALGVTAHTTNLKAAASKLVDDAVADGMVAPASHDMWMKSILPDGATELVAPEVAALASMTKGRIPQEERGQSPAPTEQVQELAWFPQFATQKGA